MQWLQDPTQTKVMQNNGTRAKLVGNSGKKRRKIIKAKPINLKQAIRTNEICTGTSMNLKMVTSAELI
jgi:hypothetical protein